MKTQTTTIDYIRVESKHYDLFIRYEGNITYQIMYSFILDTYYVDISVTSIRNTDETIKRVHNKKFDILDDAIDFCNNFQLK